MPYSKSLSTQNSLPILDFLEHCFQELSQAIWQSSCESVLWVADRGNTWMPSITIQERPTEIILEVKLPPMALEHFTTQVFPGKVVICGNHSTLTKREQQVDSEAGSSWFENTIPLPNPIDPHQAIVQVNDRALIFILQKLPSSLSISIPVCIPAPSSYP